MLKIFHAFNFRGTGYPRKLFNLPIYGMYILVYVCKGLFCTYTMYMVLNVKIYVHTCKTLCTLIYAIKSVRKSQSYFDMHVWKTYISVEDIVRNKKSYTKNCQTTYLCRLEYWNNVYWENMHWNCSGENYG